MEINKLSKELGDLWVSRCRKFPVPVLGMNGQRFKQMVQASLSTVHLYENQRLQDKARSIMPVDRFHQEARMALEDNQELGFEDHILKSLLQWFKFEFFKWVDKLDCEKCQSPTTPGRFAQPSSDDLKHGANRVETYVCQVCGHVTRFPRYNDPWVLLDQPNRRGRCGEWANCFTLLCRSLGYDTRYVVDFTDHVWTEVYSENLKRWIHLDSCEAAWDKPLLYEAGWGKKLNYVIGVSVDEVVDVTRRYTSKFEELLTRRALVSESDLGFVIADLCSHLARAQSDSYRRAVITRRSAEILSFHKIPAEDADLPGRSSGSKEWIEKRGEGGSSS